MFGTSGKFPKLKKLLQEILAKGHRVLIFSQMTRMLDILEVFLERLNLEFRRLDGQTAVTERQDIIDEFSENKSVPIFLLSTKAGGVGRQTTLW